VSAPVVARARVEITTSDLKSLGSQTEADLKRSLSGTSKVAEAELGAAGTKGGKKLGEKAGSEAGKSFKEKGKEFGGQILGAMAGLAVADFFGKAVEQAREAEVIGRTTEAVIKSTGGAANVSADQVKELAERMGEYAGMDDSAVQSSENLLLTFKNIKNEAGAGNDVFDQTTKAVLDMSAAMHTDGKSSAILLGKALNDPVKGLTALTRVGVTFTEGQKKQIAAMVKAGDTLGAQKVILKEVNSEFGGAAGAAATPAQRLSAAWQNLEEQVGTALLPILNKLVNFMTNDVVPAIRAIITWFQNNAGTIKTVAMVLAPLVAAWAAYALVTKTVAIAQGILNAIMLANPIILVIAAIAALAAAFVIAYQRSATFRQILQDVWTFLKTWGPAILALFMPVLGIPLLIWQHWSQITGFLTRVWNSVYAFIKRWGPAALAVLMPFIGIPLLIWQHWSQIAGFVSRAWSAVSSTISRWVSSTYHAVVGWVGNVVSAVASLPGKIGAVAGRMLSAGKSLMTGLWNGLKSVASGAADLATGLVNALKNGINDLLGLPLTVPRIKIGAFGHYVHIGGQTLIPRLAQGGLTDGPMMAVLGDNPSGKELVAPLDSPDTVNLLAAAMDKARGGDGAEAGGFTEDQIDRLIAAILSSHQITMDGAKVTAAVNTRNLRNGRLT
jgi:hypothetical protein